MFVPHIVPLICYLYVLVHAKVEALTERLTEGGTLAPERAAEILGITAADVVASKQTGKKGTYNMYSKIKFVKHYIL